MANFPACTQYYQYSHAGWSAHYRMCRHGVRHKVAPEDHTHIPTNLTSHTFTHQVVKEKKSNQATRCGSKFVQSSLVTLPRFCCLLRCCASGLHLGTTRISMVPPSKRWCDGQHGAIIPLPQQHCCLSCPYAGTEQGSDGVVSAICPDCQELQ